MKFGDHYDHSISEASWTAAEKIVASAGMQSIRTGSTLYCSVCGAHHRFVDVRGLLASDSPVEYALSCHILTKRSVRPVAPGRTLRSQHLRGGNPTARPLTNQ